MTEQARRAYPALSVVGLCELVGVSRSWYYAKPDPSEPAESAVVLRDAVERITLEFPGYGYRRVAAQLRRDGLVVDHKRVLRVMREESLLCCLKRRFVVTTDSEHSKTTYPNLLAGLAPPSDVPFLSVTLGAPRPGGWRC